MTNPCPCCVMEGIEFINNKRTKQDITDKQAAEECGVPLIDWLKHFELHVRPHFQMALAQDAVPLALQFVDKLQIVTDSVIRLESNVKGIEKQMKDDKGVYNLKVVPVYASLEKSLTETVRTLAAMQGEITDAIQVNVQQNVMNFDVVMNVVMEDATPEMKAKILNKIKTLKVAPVAN